MSLALRAAAEVLLERNKVKPSVLDAIQKEIEVQQEVSIMVNEMLD